MIASDSVPWYDRPARRFPVHIWMEKRFGFRVSLAPPAQQQAASGASAGRRFPALVWLEKRQAM